MVEPHRAETLATVRTAWAGLVGRALEPNAFMHPDFCLPLIEHVAPRGLIVLLVWGQASAGDRVLLAVCPVRLSGLPFRRLMASWAHELCALAFPLLDRERAEASLEAVLAWMNRFMPRCDAWLIPWVPVQGPTARLIDHVAARTSRSVQALEQIRRAALFPSHGDPAGLAAVSAKKAKDLRRQRRRLAARGRLGYASTTSADAARASAEDFFRLEARGWKGRRGTALLLRPDQVAFARCMIARMAAAGACRIDRLTVDEEPIAMGIVLSSGGRDFFWKTTYDEAHADTSPGVQFVLALTERQHASPEPSLTDSCAIAGHPMIDHLWRGRIAIADLLIAASPGSAKRFGRLVVLERLRRAARARAKGLLAVMRR